jgi:hypothetical protein
MESHGDQNYREFMNCNPFLNKLFVLLFHFFFLVGLSAQSISDSIRQEDAEEILKYLASDKLKGRVNFTKEQREAADYISKKFTEYGLQPFPGLSDFFHPFQPYPAKTKYLESIKWNNEKLTDSAFVFIPHSLQYKPSKLEDFMIIRAELPLADSLLFNNWNDSINVLIWIPYDSNIYHVTENLVLPGTKPMSDVLIVSTESEPLTLELKENKDYSDPLLYNVIGMLPGRSKANEIVIYSAHYDHIDKDRFGKRQGIFNGANDDASGTTAVMLLAKYFALRNDNERTILFTLFSGEELGLFGSKAFVGNVNLEAIKAVINIEMIGSHSRAGKKAFFLTGSAYSDLQDIFIKNLTGTGFRVLDEGSDPKQLFRRSDNYSFAERGVVAHSIMCSDDTDPCYHKPCDEIKWIDFPNMTRIIQAIALGSLGIVSGKDTPSKTGGAY